MPVPRLHLRLHAAAGTSLVLTRSEIEAELAGKAILDRPTDWPANGLMPVDGEAKLDLRFTSSTDRNTVYSRLTRNVVLNNLRNRGISGVIARHECSHDDSVVLDCRSDPASAYQETVI